MSVVAGGARAQDIQERTIKFGHLNNPGHPTSLGVRKFAEIVAAKSGGKIKVQEFAASQLSLPCGWWVDPDQAAEIARRPLPAIDAPRS